MFVLKITASRNHFFSDDLNLNIMKLVDFINLKFKLKELITQYLS